MAKKKKKSSWSFTTVLVLFNIVALLLISIYFAKPIRIYTLRAYRYYFQQKEKDNFFKSGFPEKYEVHGIDISHYQSNLYWKNLSSISFIGDTIHFRFVFIKATEGTWLEDELFDDHWKNAKKHQIVRGAYHYFHPNKDVLQQAKNFFDAVKLEPGDLPPVIDIEESKNLPKAKIVAAVKQFAILLEQKYKIKPIIYSNRNFVEDYLSDDFDEYTFWVAHYFRPTFEMNDVKWKFWQHSDKVSLLITGDKVDANVFKGSYKQLKRMTLGEIVPTIEPLQKAR